VLAPPVNLCGICDPGEEQPATLEGGSNGGSVCSQSGGSDGDAANLGKRAEVYSNELGLPPLDLATRELEPSTAADLLAQLERNLKYALTNKIRVSVDVNCHAKEPQNGLLDAAAMREGVGNKKLRTGL